MLAPESFAAVKDRPHGTPLHGAYVEGARRERWQRVFAGVATSVAREDDCFVAHDSIGQLGGMECHL